MYTENVPQKLGVVLLLVAMCVPPEGAFAEDGAQYEGRVRAYYNPQRRRVYKTADGNSPQQYLDALLLERAQAEANPVLRLYALEKATRFARDAESEYRIVHNLYEMTDVAILNVGSKSGSFVLQNRIDSADDERQPEVAPQQLYYKLANDDWFFRETKLGRIIGDNAAGIVSFDGASARVAHKKYYFVAYGGALLDADYLETRDDSCSLARRSSCFTGGGFSSDDTSNKWRAQDVRNATSKERRGDTLAAAAAGYDSDAVAVQIDFQKKTDARMVTEELGGLRLSLRPSTAWDVYGNGRADFLRGETYSTLFGVAYRTATWRLNPEYEYYDPHFKAGSFWENFHTFARSAVRMNVGHYLGRHFKFTLGVGRLHYIPDDSKSEELTTRTEIDPNTGETVGNREARLPQVPVVLTDYLGNPYYVDPVSGNLRAVPSRTATPEEAVISNYLESSKPKNGSEGTFRVEYIAQRRHQAELEISGNDGPEGRVVRYSSGFALFISNYRFRLGFGGATFRDLESARPKEYASFLELSVDYRLKERTKLLAGVELYRDAIVDRDVRGRFGVEHGF